MAIFDIWFEVGIEIPIFQDDGGNQTAHNKRSNKGQAPQHFVVSETGTTFIMTLVHFNRVFVDLEITNLYAHSLWHNHINVDILSELYRFFFLIEAEGEWRRCEGDIYQLGVSAPLFRAPRRGQLQETSFHGSKRELTTLHYHENLFWKHIIIPWSLL